MPLPFLVQLQGIRIIREALGLDHDHRVESDAQTRTARRRDVLSSVILEAEMVAYDEEIGIDGMLVPMSPVEMIQYFSRILEDPRLD